MDNKDHMDDEELRASAPLLFSLGRKEVFRVPEGYFESLPEHIEDSLLESEVADSFGEASVPEGYFDQLEEDILRKTVLGESGSPKDEKKHRILPMRRILQYGSIAAAIIAGVFLLAREATPEACETFACLFEEVGSSEELLNQMDEADLIELLEDDMLLDLTTEDGVENYILEEASLEDLIEDIDEEEFLRELESAD